MNTFYQVPNWPLVSFENEAFMSLKKMLVGFLSTYLLKSRSSINLSLDYYGFDTLFIENY